LIRLASGVSRLTGARKEVKAVRHGNSVFRDLLKLVPWAAFDQLADEYGADAAARSFTSRST
jgi:Domain of unknown function (DUF4372)